MTCQLAGRTHGQRTAGVAQHGLAHPGQRMTPDQRQATRANRRGRVRQQLRGELGQSFQGIDPGIGKAVDVLVVAHRGRVAHGLDDVLCHPISAPLLERINAGDAAEGLGEPVEGRLHVVGATREAAPEHPMFAELVPHPLLVLGATRVTDRLQPVEVRRK
ncbi:hypothetical protein FQZ97_840400 [compost metagenome]